MSKICLICKKGSRMGGKRNLLRGKYNPTKTKRKYPNLQWARLPNAAPASPAKRGGRGKRIKICTDCLKKGRHLTFKI
ncbi:MAG: L28 family ribosomal protein [bacterium]|nr:L28 family ribosomal protein [bacterium]